MGDNLLTKMGAANYYVSWIPKPELRGFWGDSLDEPPFGVTSVEVAIICPDRWDILRLKTHLLTFDPNFQRDIQVAHWQLFFLWILSQVHSMGRTVYLPIWSMLMVNVGARWAPY